MPVSDVAALSYGACTCPHLHCDLGTLHRVLWRHTQLLHHCCTLLARQVECGDVCRVGAATTPHHTTRSVHGKWQGYAQFKEAAHERGGSYADFLCDLGMPNEWCCMYPGMGHSTWMKYGRRTTVSRSVSPTPEAVVSGPPLSPTPPVLSGVQRGDQERDPSATPTAVRQRYVGVPLSQVESSLRKIPGRKLFEW